MASSRSSGSRWTSPAGIFMLVAGAIGLVYLLTEHITHVSQALPYLVLLACPLMHRFGHHHGHGHGHGDPGGGGGGTATDADRGRPASVDDRDEVPGGRRG